MSENENKSENESENESENVSENENENERVLIERSYDMKPVDLVWAWCEKRLQGGGVTTINDRCMGGGDGTRVSLLRQLQACIICSLPNHS
jgi:hypothetical protein